MRLNKLVTLVARHCSGAWILGGVAAMLEGVSRVLAPPQKQRRNAPVSIRPVPLVQPLATCKAPADRPAPAAQRDFFSIKRTHSELGFTFWVLQGHGRFASFHLFDTWTEAINAADARLSAAREEVLSTPQ